MESRQSNCLPYRSPLFEVNALREQGVTNYPMNWRRGDMIVLCKKQAVVVAKPRLSFPKEPWEEILVKTSRIKLCRGKVCDEGLFRGVGPTEVLPSVSSRHHLRRLANVVTSGNRFFRTRAPEAVLACLSAIEPSGSDEMIKAFRASKHRLLMRRLVDLVCKEEREAAQYFRRIHDL